MAKTIVTDFSVVWPVNPTTKNPIANRSKQKHIYFASLEAGKEYNENWRFSKCSGSVMPTGFDAKLQ